MTWGAFIGAIYASQIINGVKWRILNDLFIAAGRKKEFSESTAKKWLYGKGKCNSNRYFPDIEGEEEERIR